MSILVGILQKQDYIIHTSLQVYFFPIVSQTFLCQEIYGTSLSETESIGLFGCTMYDTPISCLLMDALLAHNLPLSQTIL